MHLLKLTLAPLAAFALSGCAALLPRTEHLATARYTSYEEAAAVLEALVPETSTRANVHALGFDPRHDNGVHILTYADVLQRFPVAAVTSSADTTGIKRCITAGTRCGGYAITQQVTRRERVGNFWLDSLRFKQVTRTAGWQLTAIILFVDDVVVFRQVGGRPLINEVDTVKNPLGIFQTWSEAAMGAAR
jgi:hypothetical protein